RDQGKRRKQQATGKSNREVDDDRKGEPGDDASATRTQGQDRTNKEGDGPAHPPTRERVGLVALRTEIEQSDFAMACRHGCALVHGLIGSSHARAQLRGSYSVTAVQTV
ncbi:hypothetical protein FDECE_8558, partial [Fusarium decemcellulare]